MGPGAMSRIGWDSTITTDFALTLDFVPYILQGAIASNLPGGAEALVHPREKTRKRIYRRTAVLRPISGQLC
jgi:hypothetical protein